MTRVIYISWDDHIIISNAEEKEQWIDDWIESNYFVYDFAAWLEAYYEPISIYNMTAENKAKLPTEHEEYIKHKKEMYREEAEKAFKNDFEAFVI